MLTGILETQRLKGRKDQVLNELRALEAEIQEIRLNPDRRIPVPDNQKAVPVVSLAEIERDVQIGLVATNETAGPNAVRDYVTARELAELTGSGTATIRRWLGGKIPEDARVRPWDPANPPIDDSLGERRRKILVSGLNPLLLASQAQQERLAELLSREPLAWAGRQERAASRE